MFQSNGAGSADRGDGDKFRALVIGCGRIGARWDKPGQAEILTHAHAYMSNPRLASVGFVDNDYGAAREAADVWGGTAYQDIESALSQAKPHAVSVCTPDEAHYPVLSRLLGSDALVIFAEKPLALDPGEAGQIVRRAREYGKLINVNYSRRFDPSVTAVRAAMQSGEYGRALNAVGCYTKGIIHNGSHLIDMLRYLLGEVVESRALASRSGHGPGDPTIDCWLRMENCPSVHLVGLEEDAYSAHELDLFCERGRLRFTRFGLQLESQFVVGDPLFAGYRQLSEPDCRPTGLTGALARYLENGLGAMRGTEELICPADDAARTLQVCLDLAGKA